jgi:uncharacterized membrane protein
MTPEQEAMEVWLAAANAFKNAPPNYSRDQLDQAAASVILAWAEKREAGLREALLHTAASLAAAISLLERGGKAAKKAAPSDRMFDQMVLDYKSSLEAARTLLADHRSAG